MNEDLYSMYQTVNSFPSKCFKCPVIRQYLEENDEPCSIIRKYNILQDNCELFFEPITIDTLRHDQYN